MGFTGRIRIFTLEWSITCPVPREGACCIGEDCVILTEADCGLAGGLYQGDDTVCDPNPCIGNPTENTTWGAIKNSYR